MQEVHDVLKRIWRRPLSAAGLVLLIALSVSIGACVFAVTWAMLWKPLPFKDQSSLVNLTLRSSTMGIDLGWSAPYLDHIERHSSQLEAIASYRERDMQRADVDGRPVELIKVVRIEPRIFTELGASPALGRPLLATDTARASERVALLSHAFWRSRFHGSASVVGQQIVLDGDRYTIVGVMPARFTFPSPEAQLWVPFALMPEDVSLDRAGSFGNLRAIGRLKPGATLGSASSEMKNLVMSDQGLKPIADQIGLQFDVKPLRSVWVQDRGPSLIALLSAAILLLGVAVANTYSLFLVRQLRRRQEFAVLEAVGETTGRRLRRVALEATLIALAATVIAAAIVPLGVRGLAHLDVLPKAIAQPVTIDSAVVAFLILACLIVAAVLASTSLVFRSQRVYEILRQSGSGQSVPGRLMIQKKILVVAQLAAVFVLLFSTAILMKSSYRLIHEELGFQREGNVVGVLQPASNSQSVSPNVTQQELSVWLEQISKLPGVTAAGYSSSAPFGDNINLQAFRTDSGLTRVAGASDQAYVNYISADYGRAVGLRLLRGRLLRREDEAGSARVALVDAAIADTNFRGNALGQSISVSDGVEGEFHSYSIVGVVDEVRQRSLATADEYPTLYLPRAIPYGLPGMPSRTVEFVLRAENPYGLLPHIEQLTKSSGLNLRVSNLVTMEQRIGNTMTDRLKLNQLLQFVSFAGLILAAAGLYALLAHIVISRSRELAIRKALGATPNILMLDSLTRGLKLVTIGVICGVPVAVISASVLRSRLYETSVFDLASLAVVLAVLFLVGLIATLKPAFSASHVSPMDVLRAD